MRLFVLSLSVFLASCSSLPDIPGWSNTASDPISQTIVEIEAGPAMIAAANPHAVEAGLEALRDGGTALDAAIAIQTTLSLVEPQSSGIGGGAFMVYYDAATGETTVYDGREVAPAAVTPEHWLDENGEPLPFLTAWTSGRAVGVPGVIAMLAMAHEDHGALDWADGFTFATELSDSGFEISPRMYSFMERVNQIRDVSTTPAMQNYFYDEAGNPFPIGHLLRNPEYAATLRSVANDWRNFYTGDIAQSIITAANDGALPGNMTMEDLANYRPIRREPVCREYRIWNVCSAPPPASGGVIVNELLGMLERYDMSATGPETVEGWRRFIEASRLAYSDRDAFIADTAFVGVPVEALLSDDYITARSALIERDTAIPTIPAGEPDVPGTSHFVVVDSAGNVVSMTTTVEFLFGSNRMAGGFFLNNQLTDFNFNPLNADGSPAANAPAGGKRPRSSMSPTIVFNADGEFELATGSPGGASIIAYVSKTLVGMLDWGLTPLEAIELPNVVGRGDIIRMEETFSPELADELRAISFTLDANRTENSGLHIIRRLEDGALIGGADPRREGVVGEP